VDRTRLLALLDAVRRGDTDVATAAERLAGFAPSAATHGADGTPVAVVDHHRALRCGFPEVVYAPGKTPDDLVRIATEILKRSDRLLVTRVDGEALARLLAAVPDAVHHARARAVTVTRASAGADAATGEKGAGRRGAGGRKGVAIVTAGTADVPVAEEARVTAEALGEAPVAIYDVGVAGLHRLLSRHEELRRARVLVVVAGMEGALASVVGGLVDRPVIAVPTSAGYGMNLSGVTTLLAMMNSCAPNVTVVNVDNGFGAGYTASLINRLGDESAAAL
jgi:pyridinium-3,5-biscarboxylic acid mononucleotide synthase